MPFTNAGKNEMLGLFADHAESMSLHTAAPGENGANEVTGGSYARVAVSWNAPSAGSMTASNQPLFQVPAGTTVTHVGFWSVDSPNDFIGSADVTDETFGGAGTYTLTSITASIT